MKVLVMLMMVFSSNLAALFAQNYDSLYCVIHEKYLGPEPQLYENVSENLIKFYFEEFDFVETLCVHAQDMDQYFKYDALTSTKSFEQVIVSKDQLISIDDFVPIEMLEVRGDSSGILFEHYVDFMGDDSPDKIEISYSKPYVGYKGAKKLNLSIFENVDNNYKECIGYGATFSDKPLKLYVSPVKKLGVSTLMILVKSDIEESKKMILIHADVIRK